MNKISAILEVLRVGSSVADPAKWKNRQVTANAVASVVLVGASALRTFGIIDLPISDEGAAMVGTLVLALVNSVLTFATSDKVGLPGTKP